VRVRNEPGGHKRVGFRENGGEVFGKLIEEEIKGWKNNKLIR